MLSSVVKTLLIVFGIGVLLFLAVGIYFLQTKEQDESIWVKAEDLKRQNKYLSRTIKKLRPSVRNILSDRLYKEYNQLRPYDASTEKSMSQCFAKIDSLSLREVVEYSAFLLDYFNKAARDTSMQSNLWQNTPLSFPFIQNIKMVVKRPFGDSLPDPFTGEIKRHNGVDIAVERGTPIISPADGDIIFVKDDNFFGKTIRMRHINGYETFYAHLSSATVKSGQKVKKGTTIGFVGESGWATGPHLHYELTKNGVYLDPMFYNFNLLCGN
jgi:murein DD-endopeptidase MepM/ murein hydrolase activator NlpD